MLQTLIFSLPLASTVDNRSREVKIVKHRMKEVGRSSIAEIGLRALCDNEGLHEVMAWIKLAAKLSHTPSHQVLHDANGCICKDAPPSVFSTFVYNCRT